MVKIEPSGDNLPQEKENSTNKYRKQNLQMSRIILPKETWNKNFLKYFWNKLNEVAINFLLSFSEICILKSLCI